MARGITGFRLVGSGLCLRRFRAGIVRSHSTAPPEADAKAQPISGDEASGKHLRITASSTRLPVIARAVVTDVRLESPRVKGVTFRIDDPRFIFKAGQWVDMFIPGINTVGGFSMYSSPAQLAETETLDLGIKFSKWPPAFWIHDQCKIGSTVAMRVGGDFYYAPEIGDSAYDLLLIAGGVGVNPLASMVLHANSLYKAYQENNEEYRPGRVMLLYSARTYNEILYKPLLDSVSDTYPDIVVKYFTTREQPPSSSNVTDGHITTEVLQSALETLNTSSLRTFLCGPPPMIESIKKKLLACGLSSSQILFEKWW